MKLPEYHNGCRVYDINNDRFGYVVSSRHMIIHRSHNRYDPYVYKIKYGDEIYTEKDPGMLCSGEIQPDDPKEVAFGRRFTERTVSFFKGTLNLEVYPAFPLWLNIEWPIFDDQTPHLHVWRNETDYRNWDHGFSLLLDQNASYEHDGATIEGTTDEELNMVQKILQSTATLGYNTVATTDRSIWDLFMDALSDAGEGYIKYMDYKSPPIYDLSTMSKVYSL